LAAKNDFAIGRNSRLAPTYSFLLHILKIHEDSIPGRLRANNLQDGTLYFSPLGENFRRISSALCRIFFSRQQNRIDPSH
jgi:hypothetical protein